ncbi:MAG: site-2 protease family protein [Gemmataceae bacterium]|nr:site-2 protease family protein [Gemmataceae bacterium]
MNLFEDSLAPRTRFDLNFRLGDVPVRIHPFFWLSTAILGYNAGPDGERFKYLLLWVAIAFVSILVHELGHVLMGRWFGRRGHIVLTGFCGLAVGSGDVPQRWQRIAVSLAGPGAGFLLAALVTGGFWLYNPGITLFLLGALFGVGVPLAPDVVIPHEVVWFIIFQLMRINIFWGLVNLLPIWPLDGGQVSREICERYRGRDGMRLALSISLGTAIGFAALALIEFVRKQPLIPYISLGGSLFPVLFFALVAIGNWQLLQFIRRAGPDWDRGEDEPRAPWEQDADWWKRGDSPWRD